MALAPVNVTQLNHLMNHIAAERIQRPSAPTGVTNSERPVSRPTYAPGLCQDAQMRAGVGYMAEAFKEELKGARFDPLSGTRLANHAAVLGAVLVGAQGLDPAAPGGIDSPQYKQLEAAARKVVRWSFDGATGDFNRPIAGSGKLSTSLCQAEAALQEYVEAVGTDTFLAQIFSEVVLPMVMDRIKTNYPTLFAEGSWDGTEAFDFNGFINGRMAGGTLKAASDSIQRGGGSLVSGVLEFLKLPDYVKSPAAAEAASVHSGQPGSATDAGPGLEARGRDQLGNSLRNNAPVTVTVTGQDSHHTCENGALKDAIAELGKSNERMYELARLFADRIAHLPAMFSGVRNVASENDGYAVTGEARLAYAGGPAHEMTDLPGNLLSTGFETGPAKEGDGVARSSVVDGAVQTEASPAPPSSSLNTEVQLFSAQQISSEAEPLLMKVPPGYEDAESSASTTTSGITIEVGQSDATQATDAERTLDGVAKPEEHDAVGANVLRTVKDAALPGVSDGQRTLAFQNKDAVVQQLIMSLVPGQPFAALRTAASEASNGRPEGRVNESRNLAAAFQEQVVRAPMTTAHVEHAPGAHRNLSAWAPGSGEVGNGLSTKPLATNTEHAAPSVHMDSSALNLELTMPGSIRGERPSAAAAVVRIPAAGSSQVGPSHNTQRGGSAASSPSVSPAGTLLRTTATVSAPSIYTSTHALTPSRNILALGSAGGSQARSSRVDNAMAAVTASATTTALGELQSLAAVPRIPAAGSSLVGPSQNTQRGGSTTNSPSTSPGGTLLRTSTTVPTPPNYTSTQVLIPASNTLALGVGGSDRARLSRDLNAASTTAAPATKVRTDTALGTLVHGPLMPTGRGTVSEASRGTLDSWDTSRLDDTGGGIGKAATRADGTTEAAPVPTPSDVEQLMEALNITKESGLTLRKLYAGPILRGDIKCEVGEQLAGSWYRMKDFGNRILFKTEAGYHEVFSVGRK
jgi:hypothetical protein